jgi:cell wall-associated NlpC family hydrolase
VLRAAAAGAAAVAVLVSPLPAAATPVEDARARAALLARQVDALEIRSQQATESYHLAQDRLAAAISQHLLAERRLDSARARATNQRSDAGRRVRALWQSGGAPMFATTVLASSDLHDLTGRAVNLERLVAEDRARVADARARWAAAQTAAHDLDEAADAQIRLERQVAGAQDSVRTLLAERRRLLAGASDDVRRLVDDQRRRDAEAAARAFQARVDAAAAQARAASAGAVPIDTAGLALQALAAARSQLGRPYQAGTAGPDTFDSSGLTSWAYASAGLPVPRSAAQQYYSGPHPALTDLRPGDLVFWAGRPGDPGTIHTVGLYAGQGRAVTSAAPDGVGLRPIRAAGFAGATRPQPPRPPAATPAPAPSAAPPAAVPGASRPGPPALGGSALVSVPDGPLGADRLTPRTRYLKEKVTEVFGVTSIGGWRPYDPNRDYSDHPHGKAIDIMLVPMGPSMTALGDQISIWAQVNAGVLGIKYIIWRQRSWKPERADQGWRPMEDRGSPTQNHFDHVHISLH